MKSIIKGIAAVAACAMTVTGLAACGSSSASGEKKLDFITGMATGSVHLKTLQSITDAFEKENPGGRIQFVSATLVFGLAAFDCSLAISSSHTSLGVL